MLIVYGHVHMPECMFPPICSLVHFGQMQKLAGIILKGRIFDLKNHSFKRKNQKIIKKKKKRKKRCGIGPSRSFKSFLCGISFILKV
jgi:hypothetical protein